MAKTLDQTSPAIKLGFEIMSILKDERKILSYKLKKKFYGKMIQDLYFEAEFQNSTSSFQFRLGTTNKAKSIFTAKYNRLRFELGSDEIQANGVANLIAQEIPNLSKHVSHQDGVLEEKRYQNVTLAGLKRDGMIDDYEPSLKNQDFFEGIDQWITFKGVKVPSQGKSSKKGQDEHILRFPNIPSILLKNRGESTQRKLTMEYLQAYIEGKVIHVL